MDRSWEEIRRKRRGHRGHTSSGWLHPFYQDDALHEDCAMVRIDHLIGKLPRIV